MAGEKPAAIGLHVLYAREVTMLKSNMTSRERESLQNPTMSFSRNITTDRDTKMLIDTARVAGDLPPNVLARVMKDRRIVAATLKDTRKP